MSDNPPYYLNNPGMLTYDSVVASLGAFDYDIDGYAFFPDYETGRAALKTIFFTFYADWGVLEGMADFLERRTRVNDPNPAQVARDLGDRVDVNFLTQSFGDFSPVQQENFLDAYQRMTGWRAGAVKPAGSTITRVTLPKYSRL